MSRRPKHPEAVVPDEVVRAIADEMRRRRARAASQKELGQSLGIGQAEVSRLLAVPRNGALAYRPGHDIARHLTLLFNIPYTYRLDGKLPASEWETSDMLPRRGRALAILSDEYAKPLLEALRDYPAPAGNEKWTTARWVIHLVSLKNAHDAGAIALPGVDPK